MLTEQIAQNFIDALRALELNREIEPVVAAYTENCTLGNVLTPDGFHGRVGARKFWMEYRGTFDTVESTFRNVIVCDGRAALEWTTRGTSFDGKPISYCGVSILEIEGGLVDRFSAYFDSAKLGQQILPDLLGPNTND